MLNLKEITNEYINSLNYVKKVIKREVKISGLPEPNLNKSSGCERYWSDLDAVRLPNQVLGVTDFRASGFVRTRELYPNSKYRRVDYMPMNKQNNARNGVLEVMIEMVDKMVVPFIF